MAKYKVFCLKSSSGCEEDPSYLFMIKFFSYEILKTLKQNYHTLNYLVYHLTYKCFRLCISVKSFKENTYKKTNLIPIYQRFSGIQNKSCKSKFRFNLILDSDSNQFMIMTFLNNI